MRRSLQEGVELGTVWQPRTHRPAQSIWGDIAKRSAQCNGRPGACSRGVAVGRHTVRCGCERLRGRPIRRAWVGAVSEGGAGSTALADIARRRAPRGRGTMVRPTCRAAARTGTRAVTVTCSARSRQDSMKCVFQMSTSTRAVCATGRGMETSRRRKCSSRQATPGGVLSWKVPYRQVQTGQ